MADNRPRSFDALKAFVDNLSEDEAWEVVHLVCRRFLWHAEIFDFDDARQWWGEEENGPFTEEIWEEVVNICDHVWGGKEAVYEVLDDVAERRSKEVMSQTQHP
jgi:transcription elongation factor GreA-like protein